MEVSETGRKMIEGFEGLRLEAYKDAVGVWTIGYGHTAGVKAGQKITAEEASRLLTEDLDIFSNGVEALLKRVPTQAQFDAMVSLAYNIGLGGFARSTVLRKFNEGKDKEAAAAFALWNKGGGRVLAGLIKRRAAEASHYLSTESVTENEDASMENIKGFFALNKTNVMAVVAIIGAVAGWLTGTIGPVETAGAIWAAVQTMNIRHAVTKMTSKS